MPTNFMLAKMTDVRPKCETVLYCTGDMRVMTMHQGFFAVELFRLPPWSHPLQHQAALPTLSSGAAPLFVQTLSLLPCVCGIWTTASMTQMCNTISKERLLDVLLTFFVRPSLCLFPPPPLPFVPTRYQAPRTRSRDHAKLMPVHLRLIHV